MFAHTGFWSLTNLIVGIILILVIIKLIIGISIMLKNKQKKEEVLSKENEARYREAGLSDSDIEIFRSTMRDAKGHIMAWESRLKLDEDIEMVEQVSGGLEASKQTFKYIVRHPKELTSQNDFLYKELPNMEKLTEQYIEMKKQKQMTAEMERDLNETLLLIKSLSQRLSKNYHEVLMDDVKIIKEEMMPKG
ncbi:5-bromo-4-chloroindolyl phosphate hydrolysis family protein [Lactococcus termiticola]|uniref:5-bromo-4-chloroindolyl phosphate hydrolase n=1 Tax=Lactococcus termiticola TaxID=2169526 RepID=A0A2R5HKD0_9LACT|nr:5-bromo-4-chloroindolyl phosphate hydrolysis family protein [Lactococcus termiticola]GBG97248.1 5-bromo-4-chloroindolyl phosphate hydrolase [Lactococcus termiticola]